MVLKRTNWFPWRLWLYSHLSLLADFLGRTAWMLGRNHNLLTRLAYRRSRQWILPTYRERKTSTAGPGLLSGLGLKFSTVASSGFLWIFSVTSLLVFCRLISCNRWLGFFIVAGDSAFPQAPIRRELKRLDQSYQSTACGKLRRPAEFTFAINTWWKIT